MDLMGMMKQAKEMQSKLGKLKEELALKTTEASAGGGAVGQHGDQRCRHPQVYHAVINSGIHQHPQWVLALLGMGRIQPQEHDLFPHLDQRIRSRGFLWLCDLWRKLQFWALNL